MALSASEELLYASLHVLASGPDGAADGTGFLFQVGTAHGTVSLLITNRHVINGAEKLRITFHLAQPGSLEPSGATAPLDITLDRNAPGFFDHPNPDVDLVALNIDTQTIAQLIGGTIANRFLDETLVPPWASWSSFDAFEELLMIGCPNGLFDTVNHMPIARRGTAASELQKDFDGRPEFLIDAACFPGSSGSPVYLLDRVAAVDKLTGALEGRRRMLVGILYAGPLITSEGKILKKVKKVEVESMMHLGYVVKSTELLAFKDLAEERLAADAATGVQ